MVWNYFKSHTNKCLKTQINILKLYSKSQINVYYLWWWWTRYWSPPDHSCVIPEKVLHYNERKEVLKCKMSRNAIIVRRLFENCVPLWDSHTFLGVFGCLWWPWRLKHRLHGARHWGWSCHRVQAGGEIYLRYIWEIHLSRLGRERYNWRILEWSLNAWL